MKIGITALKGRIELEGLNCVERDGYLYVYVGDIINNYNNVCRIGYANNQYIINEDINEGMKSLYPLLLLKLMMKKWYKGVHKNLGIIVEDDKIEEVIHILRSINNLYKNV